jgi:hypothetical protein
MSSHSVIEPEIVAEVTDEDFKELGIRHLRSSPRMIVLIGDITGDTIRIEEVDRVEQIGLYVSSQLLECRRIHSIPLYTSSMYSLRRTARLPVQP